MERCRHDKDRSFACSACIWAARPLKTRTEKFIVFHFEYCPFAKEDVKTCRSANIPWDVENESAGGTKPWFFMPTDSRAHGTALGDMRGYPMLYSPGFATPVEALAAAEQWEARERGVGEENATAAEEVRKLFEF